MPLVEMVVDFDNKSVHSVRIREARIDVDAVRTIVSRNESGVGTIAGKCPTSDKVCAQRIEGIGIHGHACTSKRRCAGPRPGH